MVNRSEQIDSSNFPRILVVSPDLSTFIKKDIEILSTKYEVLTQSYQWKVKWLIPLLMIRQFFALLFTCFRVKLIVVQFGGYWAWIPSLVGKLFSKPVFIILHGTDCASMPSIDYGILRKKIIKFFCGIAYRNASVLLPVSESLVKVINTYFDQDQNQGFQFHFPNLSTSSQVIFNGLDYDFWQPSIETKKEKNRFIAVYMKNQFIRKGGDLIEEVAKNFPDCTFYIAGYKPDTEEENTIENLHYLGHIPQKELLKQYQLAEFHLQLSMFEGFGLSLCESMLCHNIPIVSSVNILPQIIGDCGVVVSKKNSEVLSTAIKQCIAMTDKESRGQMARERIIEHFPLERRKDELLNILQSYK